MALKKMLAAALICSGMMACGSNESENATAEATTENATDSTGWIALFDGKTTNGWHSFRADTVGNAWKVEDGVLRLDTTNKKDGKIVDGGNLVTNEAFENFHLKLEWKIAKNGNSGIMFLVNEDSADSPWKTGPEMQVLDNAGHPDAKIVKHRAGDLYDLISSKVETVRPAGEWNLAEIILNKGSLTLKLNDSVVVETTLWDDNWKAMVAGSKFNDQPAFGTQRSGKICLQDHENEVSYRNIMIKKL